MARTFIEHHETATVLVALKWWQGRKGTVPHNLRPHFDAMPPLTEEELSALIERLVNVTSQKEPVEHENVTKL